MLHAATNDELLSKILREADQIEQNNKRANINLHSPKNVSQFEYGDISNISNRTNPNHASMR